MSAWHCHVLDIRKLNWKYKLVFRKSWNNITKKKAHILLAAICTKFTFMMWKSFHGPLLDLRHPPSLAQVHVPPKNSGSWLRIEKRSVQSKVLQKSFMINKFYYSIIIKEVHLSSITSRSLLWNFAPKTYSWGSIKNLFEKTRKKKLRRLMLTCIFEAVLMSRKPFTEFHSSLKPLPAFTTNIWCNVWV
jgi:hypothetical protein